MIVTLTKTMHTRIVGQPQRKALGQSKKADGFIYGFLTNLTATDINWNSAEDAITACLLDALNAEDIRDLEISLDIASGQYSLRFTSSTNLIEVAYAAEIGQSSDGTLWADPLNIEDALEGGYNDF